MVGRDGPQNSHPCEVSAADRRRCVTHGTRVHRLYLETGKIVGEISPTLGVHGVALALKRAKRRLFAGGRRKHLIALDAGSHVAELPDSGGVDAVAVDVSRRLAFASCGEGVVNVVKCRKIRCCFSRLVASSTTTLSLA